MKFAEEVQMEQQRLSEFASFATPHKSPSLVKQVKAFKQQSEISLPSILRQQFLLILEVVFRLIVKARVPR
jgi:hypothetical protein